MFILGCVGTENICIIILYQGKIYDVAVFYMLYLIYVIYKFVVELKSKVSTTMKSIF